MIGTGLRTPFCRLAARIQSTPPFEGPLGTTRSALSITDAEARGWPTGPWARPFRFGARVEVGGSASAARGGPTPVEWRSRDRAGSPPGGTGPDGLIRPGGAVRREAAERAPYGVPDVAGCAGWRCRRQGRCEATRADWLEAGSGVSPSRHPSHPPRTPGLSPRATARVFHVKQAVYSCSSPAARASVESDHCRDAARMSSCAEH